MKKLFIVRKYVTASSAAEALRIEKRIAPDDIWLDDDWKSLSRMEERTSWASS